MAAKIKSHFLDVLCTIFLASGGVFINPTYHKFELPYSLFFTGWMLIAVLGSTVGFLNFSATEERIEILIQIISHTVMLALHWAIKCNQVRLLTFVRHLNNQNCPHYKNLNAIGLTEKFFKKIVYVKMVLFVFFIFLVCFISLVTPFLVDLDFKDNTVYVIPFWFMCNSSRKSKSPASFLCWNINQKWKFVMMNMAQTVLFITELSCYVMSFAFYALFQSFIIAHVIVMENVIANMSKIAANQAALSGGSGDSTIGFSQVSYDDVMCTEIVKFIKFYSYLHGAVNNVLGYLHTMVAASLTGFCFVIVFSAYLLVAKNEEAGEMFFKMKMVGIMANAGMMFFLYCHGAEFTNNANNVIADAIYNMPWYQQSIRFRKMIIPLLIQIQKKFEMRVYDTYQVNLIFFMRVVRMVYTTFNVLLLTLTNENSAREKSDLIEM